MTKVPASDSTTASVLEVAKKTLPLATAAAAIPGLPTKIRAFALSLLDESNTQIANGGNVDNAKTEVLLSQAGYAAQTIRQSCSAP